MKSSIRTHEGRVALVTGAAKGIGQAIALALAERGAQIIVTDIELPGETADKIGSTAHTFQHDVTKEEDWKKLFTKTQYLGGVDIVVNNAGYFPNRPIDELDLTTWRKTMATNLDSHFLSVKYFLPAMRMKKWGRFIGISSNMVGLAITGMSHYITSKMGIIGFMRGLANDVAKVRDRALARLQHVDALDGVPQPPFFSEVQPIPLFVALNEHAEEAEEKLQVLFGLRQ